MERYGGIFRLPAANWQTTLPRSEVLATPVGLPLWSSLLPLLREDGIIFAF
jgi:hypothetical protein